MTRIISRSGEKEVEHIISKIKIVPIIVPYSGAGQGMHSQLAETGCSVLRLFKQTPTCPGGNLFDIGFLVMYSSCMHSPKSML
jgi:hypothetical protein